MAKKKPDSSLGHGDQVARTLHERLSIRRIREQASQLESRGDAWADEQRRIDSQARIDAARTEEQRNKGALAAQKRIADTPRSAKKATGQFADADALCKRMDLMRREPRYRMGSGKFNHTAACKLLARETGWSLKTIRKHTQSFKGATSLARTSPPMEDAARMLSDWESAKKSSRPRG